VKPKLDVQARSAAAFDAESKVRTSRDAHDPGLRRTMEIKFRV
jgi:hypothetical protein